MRYCVKTILTILAMLMSMTALGDKLGTPDTLARRLSVEFNRYYIDGNEEMLYKKADELLKHLQQQSDFNHSLYYSTKIDIVSFDMNQGHFYRAMKKAKELMAEMRQKEHTEEFYNGSYMMAIIYWYRNNTPLASKYFDQAISEIPKERTSDLASIYTDYANMLTDDNPDKAAQLVDQALAVSGNNSYKRTYALTMKGIIAFARRDGQTVTDCYRQYLEAKKDRKPEEVCDMYESHLRLAAMTVDGHGKEAMRLAENELDNTDRYTIQLDICDYVGDRFTGYTILEKLMKEQEAQNNLIMEDDVNEMNADLQVVEARRETQRWWMIFLISLVVLSFIAIGCLVALAVFRRQALQKLMLAYNQLEEATAVRERIESELRIARDIQQSMVPSTFPQRDGLDMYAYMEPAKEVGGDLYNYMLLGDKLYFCVGDVSGKGVPASLFMAQATRLFRTFASQGMMPAAMTTQMNHVLAEDNEQGMFVTMFIGLVDLTTGRLDFCNAGHNPPVLAGAFLEMNPNAPIGLWPALEFEGEVLESVIDRPIFLYTDGLNEAENEQQVQFGESRLLHVLRTGSFENARQVIDTFKTEVAIHRQTAEPNDDLTMMCIRLTS